MSQRPRTGLTAALLMSVLAMGMASCVAEKPDEVVGKFYATYLRGRRGGLPFGAELQRIAPFLSARLHALILAANHYQVDWVKRHPDQPGVDGHPPVILKPPFVDGDFFSSNVEGARSFKVSRTVTGPRDTWTIHVRFWYDESLEGWEDAVIVVAERGRYKIDDVVYLDEESGAARGRLSEGLRQRDVE